MTRADALRTLFLAPLGALFGALLRRKPEPYPVAWHAEHVAVVAEELPPITHVVEGTNRAFFFAKDGVYVFRDDGNFDYLRTRPRDGYFIRGPR